MRFAVYTFAPVVILVMGGESAVRLRYFVAHRDPAYLIAPFGARIGEPDREAAFKVPPPPARAASGRTVAFSASTRGPFAPQPTQQMVFAWHKPCADSVVYSPERHANLPRTFSDSCFRGDRIGRDKPPDEYRIVFVGGSTVEDAQSDEEMMTAQFKAAIPARLHGKRVTVVNAGRSGFESQRIARYYGPSIEPFAPDLVFYYEAWNEQPTDVKFTAVDDQIGRIHSRIHEALYNKLFLYTYLVEKIEFARAARTRFWKIDLSSLDKSFRTVHRLATRTGGELRFVTQVIRFPRMWKGTDTFDYRAVESLLDRLKSDRSYRYDVVEISALNQRLAVGYTIELCRQLDVPVVNILPDVEEMGKGGRAAMFIDLGHLSVAGDRIVGRLIAERSGLSATD